jgi:glyoxylase-like metal-dependent hydrolase (beta-lactamase superfamily II)
MQNFVTNVKEEEVKDALAAAHKDREIFDNTFTPVVLNTGGKTCSHRHRNRRGELRRLERARRDSFTNNLTAAGLSPAAIDTVIISHYHGDHMNGLLKADNSLAFPNAEILVPAKEHNYWMDDGEMSRAPQRPDRRTVQEQSPRFLRAMCSSACGLTSGTRKWFRA